MHLAEVQDLVLSFEQRYEKFCQKSLKKKVAKCWENGLSPARNTFTGVPFQHLVIMEGSFMPHLKAS